MKILPEVILSETELDIIRATLAEPQMARMIAHITADVLNEYGDLAGELDFTEASEVTNNKQWFVKGAIHILSSLNNFASTPVVEDTEVQNQ